MGGTDTDHVNFAIPRRAIEYIEEVAESEDKKRTDLLREAIEVFVDVDKTAKEYGTTRRNVLSSSVFEEIHDPSTIHDKCPEDGRALEGDLVSTLSYSEMWIMEEGESREVEGIDDISLGDEVICVEPSSSYFDYFVFSLTKRKGKKIFKCKVSQRISNSVFDSLSEKVGEYRI